MKGNAPRLGTKQVIMLHIYYFPYLATCVLVKLNVGLLWLKLYSTRRGLFLLPHWTL